MVENLFTEEEIRFVLDNNTPRDLAISLLTIQKIMAHEEVSVV